MLVELPNIIQCPSKANIEAY